jgi:hypothetical protein
MNGTFVDFLLFGIAIIAVSVWFVERYMGFDR